MRPVPAVSSPGTITVVGLGPAGPDLLTTQAVTAIAAHPRRWVRTRRHPAAAAVGAAESFDGIYETRSTFADVYSAIASELIARAGDGDLLYAVPGSPLVLERTVELLLAQSDVPVRLVPGLSFVDLAWVRLGIDPFEAGVRLIDGHRFEVAAAGERGPLLVAHCHSAAVLSDIKLSVADAPEAPVTVLQRLGGPDESVFDVAWSEIDRAVEPDHLTALYVPELTDPVGVAFSLFDRLVATLRRDCPWDAEQTHRSLRRHLLEETYEVLDAVDRLDDRGRGYDDLCEELGDLLFQVCLHSRMAADDGYFDVADVCRQVTDKLTERHPHVFGDADGSDREEISRRWEQDKRATKGRSSVMDGMPAALPGTLYALKVQKKAAGAGFGLADHAAAHHEVSVQLGRLGGDSSEHQIGDLLFAAVGVARLLGHDPEMAVRSAAARCEARFRLVEGWAERDGVDLATADPSVHDRFWARAGRELARGG